MWTTGDNLAGRRNMREDAEAIAISALGFLARDESRLERFLTLSGLAPDTLREAAAAPGFLAGVLDHLLADDALARQAAEDLVLAPDSLARARAALERGRPPLASI
ncbi:MAG: DUF3572 domain-containing protein [Methylobacteriaceae bacterium]|nr:DUF3572 domain-containing protein [Methylobacteriaceae bacterium]